MRNAVVLPAPLGPINARNSPRSTVKLTPLAAATPPKLTMQVVDAGKRAHAGLPLHQTREAARAEAHHQHQHRAEDQQPVVRRRARHLGQERAARSVAAKTPQTEPVPPITTMVRMAMDCTKSNVSGRMMRAK